MTLNERSTSLQNCAAPAIIVVAAALVDADGRVLMQQRPPGKAHEGLWEFPGGKVEAGETPIQALIRELREELLIVVAPEDLTPEAFVGDAATVLLLFRTTRWRGTPQALEAAALTWDTPSALARLPMPPLDVPLVAALGRSDRSA